MAKFLSAKHNCARLYKKESRRLGDFDDGLLHRPLRALKALLHSTLLLCCEIPEWRAPLTLETHFVILRIMGIYPCLQFIEYDSANQINNSSP